jgi:hypothetical protein
MIELGSNNIFNTFKEDNSNSNASSFYQEALVTPGI